MFEQEEADECGRVEVGGGWIVDFPATVGELGFGEGLLEVLEEVLGDMEVGWEVWFAEEI